MKLVLVHGPMLLKILKSFLIGTKIVKKGTSILTGLAEIINKAIRGLNFLHLWGEGRALRLRSVPLADDSVLTAVE